MANGRRTRSLYGLFESGIPPEVYLRRPGIQSRRNLYEALARQGLSPIPETRVKGRFSVPINPLQGVAKIASSMIGTHGIQNVDKELLQAYEDWKREQDANALAVSEGFADATAPQMVRGATPAVGQEQRVNVGPMDAVPPQPGLPEVPSKRDLDAYGQPPAVSGPVPPRPDAPTTMPADMTQAPIPTPLPAPAAPQPSLQELDRAEQEFYSTQALDSEPMSPDAYLPEQKRPMQPRDMTISRTMPTVGVPQVGFGQEILTPERVFALAAQISRERGIPMRQVMSHPAFLSQLRMAEQMRQQANQDYTLSRGQGRYRGGELVAERPDLPTTAAQPEWKIGERYDASVPGGVQKFRYRTVDGVYQEAPIGDVGTKGPLATAEARASTGEKGKEPLPATIDRYEGQLKAADSAYESLIALDSFMEASKTGTEGSAEPVFSAVRRLLASFGVPSEKLVDAEQMAQATAAITNQYVRQYGARGLTAGPGGELQKIAEMLPRAATSKEARELIAELMMKHYGRAIDLWKSEQVKLDKAFPDTYLFYNIPDWYPSYELRKIPDSLQGEVSQLEWNSYSDEQKRRLMEAGQ